MVKKIIFLTAFVAALSSCGKEASWKKGQRYAQKGLYPKAIFYYEKFIKQTRDLNERSQAYLALARVHSKLANYSRSQEYYELAARMNPLDSVAATAREEMLGMPDYLLLSQGTRWEEVDSDTKGEHMYSVSTVEAYPGTYLVRRKIFAGRKSRQVVKEVLLFYTKMPGIVWERQSLSDEALPTLLLRYPYRKGSSWKTWREGRAIRRTIVKDYETVEVAAGRFSGCIEVEETIEELSSPARIYDTYCPGMGRVRQAVGDREKVSVYSELSSIKTSP